MAFSSPSYLLNALAVDIESIYSMEDEAISQVFCLTEWYGLRHFLSAPSLEIFVSELFNIYEKSSIDAEGKIVMNVNEHSLLVDEGLFSSLF